MPLASLLLQLQHFDCQTVWTWTIKFFVFYWKYIKKK
jgi:hypothetical protein